VVALADLVHQVVEAWPGPVRREQRGGQARVAEPNEREPTELLDLGDAEQKWDRPDRGAARGSLTGADGITFLLTFVNSTVTG